MSHTLATTGHGQKGKPIHKASKVWYWGRPSSHVTSTYYTNMLLGTSPLDNMLDMDHTLYSASRKNSAPSTWKDSGTTPGIWQNSLSECSHRNNIKNTCILKFSTGFETKSITSGIHSRICQDGMVSPFITCQAMLPEFGKSTRASVPKHRSCKLTGGFNLLWIRETTEKNAFVFYHIFGPLFCLVRSCPRQCIQDFVG